MKKRELFKIEGNNIRRERKYCPKCGPGVFLAEHNDRSSCGKCGYTEFKGKNKRPEKTQSFEESKKNQKPDEVKPVEMTNEQRPKEEKIEESKQEEPKEQTVEKPVEDKKEGTQERNQLKK